MLFYGSDFWPMFWLVVGVGAILTVALSLLAATVPLPRPQWRRQHPQPVPGSASPDQGGSRQLPKAA